jgi:imidazolonepropionase-like amidohydrolase
VSPRGVDGIEHCSCLTADGPVLPPGLGAALAAGRIDVCPTVGFRPGVDPPPHVQARMAAVGATVEQHLAHVARLHRAGVALLAGTDAGIGPNKRHGQVAHAVADLVGCGVPLAEALNAATARAARACGLGGRTGAAGGRPRRRPARGRRRPHRRRHRPAAAHASSSFPRPGGRLGR